MNRAIWVKVWLFVTPRTVACQAPFPMEISRQKYWSGLPFPCPSNLPNQGSNLVFCTAGRSFMTWTTIQSVKSLSRVWHFVTPVQQARFPCPSPTPGSCSNLCPSSWWCHPTISSSVDLFFCLQSFPHQDLFQWVSSSHQVAKYWSFSFSISSFNEYSGLISLRMDWSDLLAVQGTLKSLLQHQSSKALILQCSSFFIV